MQSLTNDLVTNELRNFNDIIIIELQIELGRLIEDNQLYLAAKIQKILINILNDTKR